MKTLRNLLLAGAVAAAATGGRAQLFVDYGGPRNIFVVSATQKTATKTEAAEKGGAEKAAAAEPEESAAAPLRFATVDTKEKSLSLNFFALPRRGPLVFGGTVQVAGQDGLEEFLKFKKAPKVTGNVLANYTWGDPDKGYTSVTFRGEGSETPLTLHDPSTNKTTADTHRTMAGHVTLAFAFGDSGNRGWLRNAVALTAGFRPETNYEALPLVDVGNGKTARSGTLEKFDSYPLQLIYVREFEITGRWIDQLPQVEEKALKFLLVCPYAKITSRAGGGETQAYGVNFALKTVLWATGKEARPSNDKLSFPYSVYVETARAWGGDRFVTQAGVSTIFAF